MTLFRCAGDVIFDGVEPLPGQICNVRLKQFSETCNFLQHLNPLTPHHPYFFAFIQAMAPNSVITIGIAGPDIAEDAHPGHWINSVGYQSNSGKCCSSHYGSGNSREETFGVGDVLGVLVTYFGETASTVVFLKNGYPVATRFLFEADHNHFLPTISLQFGPVELELMWPEAVVDVPKYSEKRMNHWIVPHSVVYSRETHTFTYAGCDSEANIHSPCPLSTEISHFEVVVQEVGETGYGPAVALATCSPLLPSSPLPLLNDLLTFHPTGEKISVQVGDRMGWGVHYYKRARSQPTFDPRAQQLVLCYVTVNTAIVHLVVVMQPVGGFYPVVSLDAKASKVRVDMETNPQPKGQVSFLDQSFDKQYQKHVNLVAEAELASKVDHTMFRYSDSVEGLMSGPYCRIRLPGTVKGIHVIQFLSPLTEERSYICCQIRQLNEDSTLSMGIAGSDFPLNKHPGKVCPSVGWHSRLGKIARNDRTDGNLAGHRFGRGDFIGMEIETFAREMSVTLFSLNGRPVGTSYYTQADEREFLPTIGLCSNGYDIEIDVCWQNMNRGSRDFDLKNLEHWCLPSGAVVNRENNIISVPEHVGPTAIQAPYSFRRGFNHFEICLADDFGDDVPPPAIVLSTATPLEPPPVSNFKLDFLRFWAINEAARTVQKGDLVGWGITYVENDVPLNEEQLVICYLTVNRTVLLVRVVYQPPGGFYPLVILPQKVNRVQLELSDTYLDEHPFSPEDVEFLVNDAKELIAMEQEAVAQGLDPHDLHIDMGRLFRAPPHTGRGRGRNSSWPPTVRIHDTPLDARDRYRLATVVTDVTQNSKLKQNGPAKKGQTNNGAVSIQTTAAVQKDSRSCVVL